MTESIIEQRLKLLLEQVNKALSDKGATKHKDHSGSNMTT